MKDDRLISLKEVLAEIDAMPPVKAEGHEFVEKTCLKTRIGLLPSAQPERQEMTELENKQTICDLLLRTLACTRALEDLDKITYDDKTENVTVRFRGGGQRKINVTADSGVAMIRDILRNIGV